MAPWENIFEHVSIDNFKQMGNKILNTLRVAILNPVTLIEKQDEKEAILSKFHDDPNTWRSYWHYKNLGQGQKILFLERSDSRYY